MNIDKIIVRHSALTNGTAGLLISLITCSETALPIRLGSISLYFPDCMFGEDRNRLQSGARLVHRVLRPLTRQIKGKDTNFDFNAEASENKLEKI